MPGSSAMTTSTPATSRSVRPLASIWSPISSPSELSLAPLVTRMPAAVETSSAGICATRPSPMVRIVYFSNAAPADMPVNAMPITRPPTMLMAVMMRPAMASPRTNLPAPSIAP